MTTDPTPDDVTPPVRSRASRPPAARERASAPHRVTTGRIVAGGVSLTATFGMVAVMGLVPPPAPKSTVVLDASSGENLDATTIDPEADAVAGADPAAGFLPAEAGPDDAAPVAPADATDVPSPVTTTGGARPGVTPATNPTPRPASRPAAVPATPSPTAARPPAAPAPTAVAPTPTAAPRPPTPTPAPTAAPPKPKPTTPPTTVTKAS